MLFEARVVAHWLSTSTCVACVTACRAPPPTFDSFDDSSSESAATANGTSVGGTTGSSTGDTSTGSEDPCALGDLGDFLSCEVPEGCESVQIVGDCGSPPELNTLVYAECLLEALRTNTVGFYEVTDTETNPNCAAYYHIIVLGDGTALTLYRGVYGKPHESARRVQLRPPDFYEACLASGEASQMAQCVRDWYVEDSCLPDACCPLAGSSFPICG